MKRDGRIELFVLGGIALRGVDPAVEHALLAQPKVTALLAFLAMSPEQRPQRRDRIIGLLWPELDQSHARTALRKAIHALRKALGSGAVLSRGDEELVLPLEFWCDAAELARAYAASQLAHAVELYKGEFMPGFFLAESTEFERWLDTQRTTARECAAAAALSLARILEQEDSFTTAGRMARKAVAFKWDDERVLRRAIELLARVGDKAGALRLYDDFVIRMRQEFAASPAEETRKLAESLRS